MKKILITGKNSYIGTSVENWLMKEPDNYHVDTIDMKDGSWKEKDFSKYDVVFHVAGIAHIKENKGNQDLYYKVNRDLAFKTAKKAKEEGVRQFVFLSSMSVYGIETGVITKNTPLKPKNAYGKSKVQAEDLINQLTNNSFRIATLRPPMVYGKGCKGNYPKLANLALWIPVFPIVNNKRSMIYIDNLSEFIKQLIDNESAGVYFPQNADYVNTSEMVKEIATYNNNKMKMTKTLNYLIRILNIGIAKKIFGNLVYDLNMSEYISNYRVYSFQESIKITEEQ